jgi:ribosomal protein S27AE
VTVTTSINCDNFFRNSIDKPYFCVYNIGMTKNPNRPRCPQCGSAVVYVRINGDVVCRRCGHVSKQAESAKK